MFSASRSRVQIPIVLDGAPTSGDGRAQHLPWSVKTVALSMKAGAIEREPLPACLRLLQSS